MQIKKFLAGGLAAAMAGATLAFGAIASDLGDYVDIGTAGALDSPRIVIGSSAGSATEYPKDVAAAGDIAAAMAGHATTTVTISGGAITSVSGGIDVATTSKKLYFHSLLNRARSTLTATHLPTLLESGTAEDIGISGAYNYDQYINLGAKQTKFGLNNIWDDAELYVDIGSDATTEPAYNLTIVFTQPLNVSHSDVRGGTLTFATNAYIIGAGSGPSGGTTPNDKLVLLSGATTVVVETDAPLTVSLAGVDHTIEVITIESTTTAAIKVDGKSKTVTEEADPYSITGDKGAVSVYVKAVNAIGTTGAGSVELIIGASKTTVENGQAVKTGVTTTTSIDGTRCFITSDASGLSKIVISVAGPDINENYVLPGEANAFVDPVFGSFKVAFHGMTPPLDDDSRDTITIDDIGNTGASVAITDYRGYSKTINFAYNTTAPQMNWTATRTIHVLEGEEVSRSDYFLVAPEQESDFGHMMQLTDMDNIGSTNPSFTVQDILSAASMTFYFTSTGDGPWTKTFYLDGQTYYAHNTSSTKMNFTWGDTTASDGDTGAKTIVFPLVRLAGGEYITLVQNQTFGTHGRADENVTQGGQGIMELPTGDVYISTKNATGNAGATDEVNIIMNTSGNSTLVDVNVTMGDERGYEVAVKQVTWKIGIEAVNISAPAGNAGALVKWAAPSTTYISKTDNAKQIGVLVLQEADNTTTTKDAVLVGLTWTSTDKTSIANPSLTGAYESAGSQSNTYVTDYLNVYGTQVKATSSSSAGGQVVIKYPDDQGVVTVAFGADPVFSTAAIGGSYQAAYEITEPVVLLDNEVTATSALAYDLILIGGPCANTVVAALLTGAGETCADWVYDTGLIKEVTNAFTSGKKALIIAGTGADDTRSLAEQVMDGIMSYAD